MLQELAESHLLFPGGVGITRQFFVGQARAGRIHRRYLSFEKFPQQDHRLRSLVEGKAQVGGHLANIVVWRIVLQD